MLTITIRDREKQKYYRARVTPQWAQRHNNGALISCGLTVGEYGFTERTLKGLIQRGQAVEIDHTTWNHSGCQSACVTRGDVKCQW